MLVGIAKLASESSVLGSKPRVQYFELATRRFIGRVSAERMPFEWTVNPYRGCEFGCKYCYARYTHEFMELHDPVQFETQIYVKHFVPTLFRRELARVPHAECIAIGTATDPYQPAERRFGITRRMLSIFAAELGRSVSIATKSDLVARDTALFATIAARNSLHVSMTITTVDERLARVLEPYAPRPALRLAAIERLARAGIHVSVLASPMMPLINDSRQSIDRLARAASDAGASYLMSRALFLKPCAQKAFFPMLEQTFPHLLRRYRERYEKSPFLNGEYPERLARIVDEVRTRYGLTRKVERSSGFWSPDGQLALF